MKAQMVNEATLALKTEDDTTRVGDWISLFSGGRWYPLDPRVEEVKIEDIAHSLSLLCRYNGHCRFFYSVAEHCWLLSKAVPKEYQLEALLHDASEAYTSDIPRPFKYSKNMNAFRKVEDLNAAVVYKFAGLKYPESAVVKDFDRRIVRNEGEVLLPNCTWFENLERVPNTEIIGIAPKKMEQLYLERYYELKK